MSDLQAAFNESLRRMSEDVAKATDDALREAHKNGCPQCKRPTHIEALVLLDLPPLIKDGVSIVVRKLIMCVDCFKMYKETQR